MNKILGFLLILSPMLVHGSKIEQKMQAYFDSFGSSSNVNSAEIYKGQKAGYATGGGLTVRNRVLNTTPATIDLPKVDAGCGGIDIYSGGFSFINSEELINNLKSIASSSQGYAFMLALETVSPQIANNIKQMQSWANEINNMNINSCETASQLVGSVWPKETMARQHICKTTGTQTGLFADTVRSRHQCAEYNSRQRAEEKIKDQYPSLLIGNYNIAWEAIQRHEFLSTNPEMAEFFMNIVGTIVFSSDGYNEEKVQIYPSKVSDDTFLAHLIQGGPVQLYKCEDEKCIVIKHKIEEISEEHSWVGKIKRMLLTIQQKILLDEELTQKEIQLITRSRLPLYKYINILTLYKRGDCPIEIHQTAEIIARDMMIVYLKDIIDSVRYGCKQLAKNQFYKDQIDEYISSLDRIESRVRFFDVKESKDLHKEILFNERMENIERQLREEFSLY